MRRFLLFLFGLLVATALLAAVAYVDTRYPRLRTVVVPVAGLSREVRLLQVSDLGGKEWGPRQAMIADLLRGRTYDVAVLTGDMMAGPGHAMTAVDDAVRVVEPHAPRVYYVRGNHDARALGPHLAKAGVPELPRDGAVPLTADVPREEAALVYGKTSATIAAARGTGKRLLVVASHTPPDPHRLAAGTALGGGTHLFVSGHTHGGQIRVPLLGALYAPLSWPEEERAPARGNEITFLPEWKGRFVDGMYRRDGQQVFVSRGLDSNTVGVRLFCRAEIVEYRFVPAEAR